MTTNTHNTRTKNNNIYGVNNKYSIILPTYNERENLPLIISMLTYEFQCIIKSSNNSNENNSTNSNNNNNNN